MTLIQTHLLTANGVVSNPDIRSTVFYNIMCFFCQDEHMEMVKWLSSRMHTHASDPCLRCTVCFVFYWNDLRASCKHMRMRDVEYSTNLNANQFCCVAELFLALEQVIASLEWITYKSQLTE
jgi:hypothetical protein